MSTTREKDTATAKARYGERIGTPLLHGVPAFADGCAHRDKQVIVYIERELAAYERDPSLARYIRALLSELKRGEHVK